jgi:serine O-acetyltransferase
MLHFGIRSKFAISVHRFGYKIDNELSNKSIFFRLFQGISILGRYLSVVFCKVMIDERSKLGERLWLSPKGNIMVGIQSIGDDCIIHHNVTLGMGLGHLKHGVAPRVGNDVWVGPDSIIHGDVVIEDGATILSGSVIAKNVLSGCVVAGNPARIVERNFNNHSLRLSGRYDITLNSLKNKDSPND